MGGRCGESSARGDSPLPRRSCRTSSGSSEVRSMSSAGICSLLTSLADMPVVSEP